MNILISSAGRRVSLVRAFKNELKKHFPKGKVYASDANPKLSGACQVADGYFKVPMVNHPEYSKVLFDKCKELNISLLVPTIDDELLPLSKNANKLKALNVHALVACEDFVNKCRNKRKIHEFFAEMDIASAKEFEKDSYTLPLFIKPINGSRSVDTFLIEEEKQLTKYHFENDKLMFLEYLDHNLYDEYTCDLYYGRDCKLKCIVPRKRLEVRDGEVNKALAVDNELLPYLKKRLGHIEGAVGCLTAQFFMHKENKNIFGIEINPRFGGGYPLSYLAGANFVAWIIKEYLLKETIKEQFDCWERDLLMIRYDDEILVHGYKG